MCLVNSIFHLTMHRILIFGTFSNEHYFTQEIPKIPLIEYVGLFLVMPFHAVHKALFILFQNKFNAIKFHTFLLSSYKLLFCAKNCPVICDKGCTRTNICRDQAMQFFFLQYFEQKWTITIGQKSIFTNATWKRVAKTIKIQFWKHC